jgi:arylsulfatase A-like enzyme
LVNINSEDKSIPIPGIPQLKRSQKKIILVSIDTLQAGHLGIYGYGRNTSTHIDEFAKGTDATVFSNAYTPIPSTVPAHISMFTGLYPAVLYASSDVVSVANSSRTENTGNNGLMTLAQIFQNNGYKTAAFYSSQELQNTDVSPGFETYDPKLGDPWPKDANPNERSSSATNGLAFNWLDNNYQSDFFLWIHYYDPHSPYNASCAQNLYSKGLKPTNPDYINGGGEIGDSTKWGDITQADYSYLEAKYDEEIYCVDKEFGSLIDKLKALGIYDDTTLILVGDHGENFDHSSLFHGYNLYQSAVHIPFIVKSPLVKTQERSTPVSLVDITPSLVDFFSLKIPGSTKFDGISINSLPENKERTLYMESALTAGDMVNYYGLIYQNFKFLNKGNAYELYNLTDDQGENNNLMNMADPYIPKVFENILSAHFSSKKD